MPAVSDITQLEHFSCSVPLCRRGETLGPNVLDASQTADHILQQFIRQCPPQVSTLDIRLEFGGFHEPKLRGTIITHKYPGCMPSRQPPLSWAEVDQALAGMPSMRKVTITVYCGEPGGEMEWDRDNLRGLKRKFSHFKMMRCESS